MKTAVLFFISCLYLSAKGFAQAPNYEPGTWPSDQVIIRGSSLKLQEEEKGKKHTILDGKKNTVITIKTSRAPGDQIKERLILDLGGYFNQEVIAEEVSYRYSYSATLLQRRVRYHFRTGDDIGSIDFIYDESGRDLYEISGFLIRKGKIKTTLHFEIKGWLSVSTD